jgi:hypothetical protein
MNQRYYRAASDAVYEAVRLQLDAAFGHPGPEAVTAFTPAADAPHDSQGRPVLAVLEEFITWESVKTVLPDLLAGGLVTEITAADYLAALADALALLPESPSPVS